MGNLPTLPPSSSSSDMSDMEQSDDDFEEVMQYEVLHNHGDGENYYMAMFLQRIIETGQVRLHDNLKNLKLPLIKQKPCIDKLKPSTIYQTISNASGESVAENSPKTPKWCVLKTLYQRERGLGARTVGFSQPEKCKINNKYLPNVKKTAISLDKKVFCGILSKDGNKFMTASQDSVIRVYDSSNSNYKQINQIDAKHVSWSILDVAFSPDGQYFCYSTWSNCLYISRIDGKTEDIQSLSLDPLLHKFAIFSVAFSNCGKQLIGGGNDGCLYIYDRASSYRTLRIKMVGPLCPTEVPRNRSDSDVNSVGFLDETSNIVYTGLDNGVIKIWDRRCLNESRLDPVGQLIGHYDGVTFIDPKNDGRYLISNSKDQSIKLWDLRVFSKSGAERSAFPGGQRNLGKYDWDYRWDDVPEEYYKIPIMPDDPSIMTYKGHRIAKSLIRAKFSPLENTGQRFVYTGCATGRVVIYDVLTGKIAKIIKGHTDIVRDVAWHPYRTEILSSSWDSTVNLNIYRQPQEPQKKRQRAYAVDGRSSLAPPRRSRRIAQRRAENTL